MRYYYQCKKEDEIAQRIYKEGFRIKNNIPIVNGLYTFTGSKIGFKNKTELNTISKDELDRKLLERNLYIGYYKTQDDYYIKQMLLMYKQNEKI